MALKMADLQEFLNTYLIENEYPIILGPNWVDMPDVVVMITRTGGRGTVIFEGAYEEDGFQIRVRGPQNDYATVEALALSIDSILLFTDWNTSPINSAIGSQPFLSIYRTGSSPTPEPWDDASRTTFTCNYGIQYGSGEAG